MKQSNFKIIASYFRQLILQRQIFHRSSCDSDSESEPEYEIEPKKPEKPPQIIKKKIKVRISGIVKNIC